MFAKLNRISQHTIHRADLETQPVVVNTHQLIYVEPCKSPVNGKEIGSTLYFSSGQTISVSEKQDEVLQKLWGSVVIPGDLFDPLKGYPAMYGPVAPYHQYPLAGTAADVPVSDKLQSLTAGSR